MDQTATSDKTLTDDFILRLAKTSYVCVITLRESGRVIVVLTAKRYLTDFNEVRKAFLKEAANIKETNNLGSVSLSYY